MQKYGVNELRRMFLEFFESKGHLAMKSFSLVPHNGRRYGAGTYKGNRGMQKAVPLDGWILVEGRW